MKCILLIYVTESIRKECPIYGLERNVDKTEEQDNLMIDFTHHRMTGMKEMFHLANY
jgi:hypothetical protein